MYPILQIGPLAFPLPQFSILLSIWIGLSLAEKTSSKHGVSSDDLTNLIFVCLLTGLFGARLGYVIQYPNAFIQSPISLISLNQGLLDGFSGLAFAVIGLITYAGIKKLKLWTLLDAVTPFLTIVLIGFAISHIASGEAYGSETNAAWGIMLWGAKRHPTQIYELVIAIAICCLTAYRSNTNFNRAKNVSLPHTGENDSEDQAHSARPSGLLFLYFTILTSTGIIFLEAFRGDSLTTFGGLRSMQILAWIVLLMAMLTLEKINSRGLD